MVKLIKLTLYPFVPVYAFVISLRNWFFNKNIFKEKSVGAKIISVGNISVGGTGKTPLVIALTNLLKKNGKNVGVLSRGYRRNTRGYLLVSDGKSILAPVDNCGDEIFITAMECRTPAAVSEKRAKGAQQLIEDTAVDTIVLDDAYQHRWISRDINLLVFEQRFLTEEDFFKKNLLPTGMMREPFSSINRADAVIINRKFTPKEEIPVKYNKYFENKKIFTAYYKAIGFVDVKKNESYGLEDFRDQRSLVVSGVANPFSFINILTQSKIDTSNQMIFRDHKNYSNKEVQEIRKKFYSTNSHSVVTTEKDAVKLTQYSKELDDIDIFFLKIELRMDKENEFEDFIFSGINKNYKKKIS
ncbi:MAG TPA: tetraacyldisaccharide 4'-kinase [Ignavibacteriaceae bacterium]|nr:tetraacyldisaccharide 4'-kinase [Ignavibacteriaceae bacterium]